MGFGRKGRSPARETSGPVSLVGRDQTSQKRTGSLGDTPRRRRFVKSQPSQLTQKNPALVIVIR
jgi:hypothetical protein